VYLVRVGRAIYVIGVSDGGLVKLGEMAEADLVDGAPQVKSGV
jgi:hypothetical protein